MNTKILQGRYPWRSLPSNHGNRSAVQRTWQPTIKWEILKLHRRAEPISSAAAGHHRQAREAPTPWTQNMLKSDFNTGRNKQKFLLVRGRTNYIGTQMILPMLRWPHHIEPTKYMVRTRCPTGPSSVRCRWTCSFQLVTDGPAGHWLFRPLH